MFKKRDLDNKKLHKYSTEVCNHSTSMLDSIKSRDSIQEKYISYHVQNQNITAALQQIAIWRFMQPSAPKNNQPMKTWRRPM